MSESTNMLGEVICRESPELNPSFLDSDNILWKVVDGEWIGKRSVFTHDFRACWLEECKEKDVKSWWCGKDSNYSETFKR